jgi:hypothetical protein
MKEAADARRLAWGKSYADIHNSGKGNDHFISLSFNAFFWYSPFSIPSANQNCKVPFPFGNRSGEPP